MSSLNFKGHLNLFCCSSSSFSRTGLLVAFNFFWLKSKLSVKQYWFVFFAFTVPSIYLVSLWCKPNIMCTLYIYMAWIHWKIGHYVSEIHSPTQATRIKMSSRGLFIYCDYFKSWNKLTHLSPIIFICIWLVSLIICLGMAHKRELIAINFLFPAAVVILLCVIIG